MGSKGKKKKKKSKEVICESMLVIDLQTEIPQNDSEKSAQLDFSQRKDRFLVVTTVMGVLVLVLKVLTQMGTEFFNRFYLQNINIFGIENMFISYEQVISTLSTSSCIILIGTFLIYCVYELYNFRAVQNNLEMRDEAEEWYVNVFKIALSLILSDAFIASVTAYVFSDEKIGFYAILLVWLLGIIGVILIAIKEKWTKNDAIKNNLKIFMRTILVHIVISFLLFVFFFLYSHDERGALITYFDDENIVLEFQSAYYPNEIECIVSVGENKLKEKCLFDDYGESAFIEKIYATEKGKDDNTILKENYYCHIYTINIADLCIKGSNKIDIIFLINNTEYHIRNTLYYNEEYNYTKSKMQLEL